MPKNLHLLGAVLASAWLLTAHGLSGQEKPKELDIVQMRQLRWLTPTKDGALAAARPELARQLKLSPELTREIQSLASQSLALRWKQQSITKRVSYYYKSIEEAPANGETPRSLQVLREKFKEELTHGDRFLVESTQKYDELSDRVDALLTAEQRAALKGLEPQPMREEVVATSSFEKVAFSPPTNRNMSVSMDGKTLVVADPRQVLTYSKPEFQLLRTVTEVMKHVEPRPLKLLFDLRGETQLMYLVRGAPQNSGPLTIDVVDLKTQTTNRKFVLEGKLKPAYAIDISPNGKQLAALADDAAVCIFNSETGGKIKTLTSELAGDVVGQVTFSPDGLLLAVVSRQQGIGLWRTADWTLLNRIPRQPGCDMPLIACSHDGQQIVGYWGPYSWDGGTPRFPSYDAIPVLSLMKIWNTSTGVARAELLPSPKAYPEYIRGLTFSPDGKRLVLRHTDSVSVWDLSELREIAATRLTPEQALRLNEQVIADVIPEADGRLLVRRRSTPTSSVLSYLSLPSKP